MTENLTIQVMYLNTLSLILSFQFLIELPGVILLQFIGKWVETLILSSSKSANELEYSCL